MRIKDGFLLRQVAGQTVVLPCGDEMDLNMMITLNETAAFLWQLLQEETDVEAMVAELLKEYDVDADTAREAVNAFVAKLGENGFLA